MTGKDEFDSAVEGFKATHGVIFDEEALKRAFGRLNETSLTVRTEEFRKSMEAISVSISAIQGETKIWTAGLESAEGTVFMYERVVKIIEDAGVDPKIVSTYDIDVNGYNEIILDEDGMKTFDSEGQIEVVRRNWPSLQVGIRVIDTLLQDGWTAS